MMPDMHELYRPEQRQPGDDDGHWLWDALALVAAAIIAAVIWIAGGVGASVR